MLKIALTRSIFQPKMHQIAFGGRGLRPTILDKGSLLLRVGDGGNGGKGENRKKGVDAKGRERGKGEERGIDRPIRLCFQCC